MTCQTLRIAAAPRAHRAARQLLLLTALLALTAGCGSDPSGVSLSLVAPAPDQVLTVAEHDTDPDVANLQFDVEGASKGIDQGTTVNLFIDDEEQAVNGRIEGDGRLSIPDVTLPPGTHRIYLQTSTGSASSDQDQEYTLKALVIDSPNNGAMLSMEDDEDAAEEGVQISVTVTAFALDADADITLLLDGDEVETKTADDDGEVVYSGITLSNGRHTFRAVSGEGEDAVESGRVSVEVRQSCAAVTFLQPAPPSDDADSISLGGDSCPASGDEFVTRVAISTDAGNGRPVTLLVNGTAFASTMVDGATAVFEDVVLTRFNSANTIAVDVENSEGVNCVEPFPGDVFVDCEGSDCSIVGPTPVSFVDGDSELSLYLNAAHRDDDGFDIEVESDAAHDGQRIQLVIDRDTRRPLTQTAEASGDTSTAEFRGVNLPEGQHTIEALCTDAAGNVTSSGERTWIVDTTACGVTVTDPAEDTLFVPGDDEDNASAGTQIVASSTITGSDCARQRSRVCDPAQGISGADFVAFDGNSPLLTTLTLDDTTAEQALCVEVEDRAGNVGLGSATVTYRASQPQLLIENPSDGDQYNALGNDGYVADANSVSSACDAEFSIACSELGVEVRLHHDDGSSTPFATAECQERQDGDPALPAGYAGRAKLTAAFGDGDQTAVIVATQSVAGSSATELVGVSDAITLGGDCRAPMLFFSGAPCGPVNQLSEAQAMSRSFGVTDSLADTMSVSMSFTNDDGTSGSMLAPTSTNPASAPFSAASWSDIDLGGAGSGESGVTISAIATDDFANSATITCAATIVSDLPEIVSLTAPADDAVFVTGDECNTGTPGEFGVQVLATADQQADRTVSVLVNGGEVASPAALGSTAIDLCVPVPDNTTQGGPSTITLRLQSTLGVGTAEETRTVSVLASGPSPDTGIVIDMLPAPSLDDATHRAGITATWPAPEEDFPGQLSTYALRCHADEIAAAASDLDKDAWWDEADEVDLPDELTPADPSPAVELAFRPEEPRHCAIRAGDLAGQLTPIVESTDLTLKLRQIVLAAGAASTTQSFGGQVVAVGDVDGDLIDDLLVGARGRAELIFGGTDLSSLTKVVFIGPTGNVGRAVSGLGDINGDGFADFAVGDPYWNASAGRVSVFLGRPRTDWPTTAQDIESSCNADLCLEGGGTGVMGRSLGAAGDFDGDGQPDFVIGSPFYPTVTAAPYTGNVLIVLGGCASLGICGLTPGGSFFGFAADIPTGDWITPPPGTPPARLSGFSLEGSGALENSQLGFSIAGLGAFDANSGDDLAIGANRVGEVHYLSGRAHSGTAGFDVLSVADLGVPGEPAGTPIASGPTLSFGVTVAAVGDFYDAGGTGVPDLAVGLSAADSMYLEPGDGDPAFSATSVRISGPASNIGTSVASALKAFTGSDHDGDLDGDGQPELCVGTRTSSPRDIMIWYADTFAASVSADTVQRSSGISIALTPAGAGSAEVFVQYVGDLNDDGYPDIAVGDPRIDGNRGQLILLY